MEIHSPVMTATPDRVVELHRLGDEIADLSAHVDATALEDPDQPGPSVLEDGPHVPAETSRRDAAAHGDCCAPA
jgi:hypothetical protein